MFLPKTFGKTVVDRFPGVDFLQEFPGSLGSAQPSDQSQWCLRPHGNTWQKQFRRAGPGLAGQPDPACDVAPDDLFDEGFQVWAAGRRRR